MQIPFFSLERKLKTDQSIYLQRIKELFDSKSFIGGSAVSSFEKELSAKLDNAHVIGCNSGTDALWMALKAVELKPNDIVLTTPFSFIASSSEIVAHRGIPLFIDIDPQTYNLCPQKLEHFLISECTIKNGKTIVTKTDAPVVGILAVDIFGQLADYHSLKKIAKEWNLWIIEDACQSLGATLDNKPAGTWGEIGTFSFYPTKNLGAFGDAGAIVTNNESYFNYITKLKNHGRSTHYQYEFLGINSRLDAIQAILLEARLKTIDAELAQRKKIAQQYNEAFKDLPYLQTPKQIIGSHSYNQYSIQLQGSNGPEARELLAQKLTEKGIGSRIFYPEPLNKIPFLNEQKEYLRPCPVTEHLCQTILSLPIWPELEKNEIDLIISATLEALETLYPHSKTIDTYETEKHQ